MYRAVMRMPFFTFKFEEEGISNIPPLHIYLTSLTENLVFSSGC